jgi:hypothetical protein
MRITDVAFTAFAMFACGALYGAFRNGAAEVGGDALVETLFFVAVGAFVAHLIGRTAEYIRER